MSVEYVALPFLQQPSVGLRESNPVANDAAERLGTALENGGFWATRSWEPSQVDSSDAWVIEGRTKTGYHAVTRRTSQGAIFKALGVPFFTLARQPLPERTVSTDKDIKR